MGKKKEQLPSQTGSFRSSDSALLSALQGPTYAQISSMSPLLKEEDPYMVVGPYTEEVFLDEEDEVLYTDVGVASSEEDEIYDDLDNVIPQEQNVEEEFEEYLEAHGPLKAEKEDALRSMDIDQKRTTIAQEQGKGPIYSAKYYVDGLKAHIDGTQNPRPPFRKGGDKSGGAGTLTNLLKKLKLDLKVSDERFVTEFVNAPNKGFELLMSVLNDIHKEMGALSSTSIKNGKRELHNQATLDEYSTLLCIKFILRVEEGLDALLKKKQPLVNVALGLYSTHAPSRKVVVQIFTLACVAPNGHLRAIDALSSLQVMATEPFRFKHLVSILHSSSNTAFQTVCLKFLNTLWRCTENSNAKVHLQHEITLAGFDPSAFGKDLVTSAKAVDLRQELDAWNQNFIEVSGSKQKVFDLETRNSQLRDEVNRLQIRIQTAEKEVSNAQQNLLSWKDKGEKYRERAAELQDTITKLTDLYREKTGLNPEEEVNLEEAIKSLDAYSTLKSNTNSISRPPLTSITETPLPPAPPLPSGPKALSETLRQKVTPRVSLPMLNWTPLHSVKGSIFETINDREVLKELDFSQFEAEFQLPSRSEDQQARARRVKAITRYNDQIHFVEMNRAKNMIITKTRIAKGVQQRLFWEDPLSARDIKDAIEKCDLQILPGEYAELLLKYIPTKEEMDLLARHARQYAQLGESEQFLFHLAQIDRPSSRLSLMAFIGVFEEILTTLVPKIESVSQSSQSVLNSAKLRKVLEIILAYGNYMNTCKRGYVYGFKLESLAKLKDVKSLNREKTFLHHLVELIARQYPNLSNFYDDLNITVNKGVSYQALASDMHGLRKGIDLVKYEMEKQPNNAVLQDFHAPASTAIAKIADAFHKMEDAYSKVCNVHGESAKKVEPDEFFGYITTLVTDYKRAAQQNQKRQSTSPVSPLSPATPSLLQPKVANTPPPAKQTMVQTKTIDFTSAAKTIVSRSQQNRPTAASFRAASAPDATTTPGPVLNASLEDDVFTPEKEQPEPFYAVPVKRKPSAAQEQQKAKPQLKKQIVVRHKLPRIAVSQIQDKKPANGVHGGYPEPTSPHYQNQVEEAIGSLDQVLDDEDGSKIIRTESSRL